MANYVPLHVHFTNGSVGDSVLKIKDFVEKCSVLGIKKAAMTDHGSLSAILDFSDATKKAGMTGIIGMEAYVAADCQDRTKRDESHLLLLAKNAEGVKNLMRIHNYAQLEGFYYKPRTDISYLKQYASNLIATSACVGGEIPKFILQDNLVAARELALQYAEIFDAFYFEIQPGHFEAQLKVNRELVKMSRELGIPLVATNDIHYLNASDWEMHDAHVKSVQKREGEEPIYPDTCYYLMSHEDFLHSFVTDNIVTTDIVLEAIENTNVIADQCDGEFSVEFEKPSYPYIIEGETEYSQLCKFCFEALNNRFQELRDPSVYVDRLAYELETIDTLGLSGYFLIVKDLVNHAKEIGIAVGPGRGSGVASIVLWLLGITLADPIKYDLMFERFLSPKRKGWPDIDLDFESSRRWEMQSYVFDRFGKENCAFISTFGLRKAKSALKAAGRLLSTPLDIIDEISKVIPFSFYDEDGEKNADPTLSEHLKNSATLRAYQERYPALFEKALQLESFPCAMGVHAAGVILGSKSLMDTIPLKIYHDKSHNFETVATTLTKEQVERFRLKYDFLSLRTLSIVDKTMKDAGISFDFNDDDIYNDDEVWNLIGSSNTEGLFQISSQIYKARMPRLKPRTIPELAACLALVRAPSITAKTDEIYMQVREGRRKPETLCPEYDYITKDTNGIVIYQEQIIELGVAFGLQKEAAYDLMKAVSKKKIQKIRSMKELFYQKAREKNTREEIIDRIWDIIQMAGLYSFNAGHATAYALITYASAWLKVHYTTIFMANLLSNVYEGNNDRKISDAVQNAKSLKLDFLPPDINRSRWEFTVEDGSIRIGFCAVKSLGETAAKEIIAHQTYNDIEDLYNKINRRVVNKKVMDAAILSGAFGNNLAEVAAVYYSLKGGDVPAQFVLAKDCSVTLEDSPKRIEKAILRENFLY